MPERLLVPRFRIRASRDIRRNGVFILGRLSGITIRKCMATPLAVRRNKGLLWRPLSKAPPSGRGWFTGGFGSAPGVEDE
jgi:hypothetical protein